MQAGLRMVDEGEGPEVGHVIFEWSPEGNFIISTQAVTMKDTLVSRVTEWIGWDPSTSQVRSWSFEGDGGIGEGVWTNQGDQWIVKTNVILPRRQETGSHQRGHPHRFRHGYVCPQLRGSQGDERGRSAWCSGI